MKVIVATKNPGKIEGAKRALEKYFTDIEIEGIPAASDVGEQPVNEDIYIGAKNRVKNLKKYCSENDIKADLYLSIESGINNVLGRWMITNIAVIEDKFDLSDAQWSGLAFKNWTDENGNVITKIERGTTGNITLTANWLHQERHNNEGGINLLTRGVVSRIDITEMAFVMALVKYLNTNWR